MSFRTGWDSRLPSAARAHMRLRRCVSRTGLKSSTALGQNEQGPHKGALFVLAERVGFEPTVRVNRTLDFESSPFDHSGTSPVGALILVSIRPDVKYAFRPSDAILVAGCDTEYRACACC